MRLQLSSKRRIRKKACTGKVVFQEKDGAVTAAQSMRYHGSRLHAYKCPFSEHWNIGHHNKQGRQSIRDQIAAREG